MSEQFRKRAATLVAAGVGAIVATTGTTSNSGAWNNGNLALRSVFGTNDYVENYDREGQSVNISHDLDWPVTMIFYNHADIEEVKGRLRNQAYADAAASGDYSQLYLSNGDNMHLSMADPDTGPPDKYFDADGGIKNATWPCTTSFHLREYANPNFDANWNPTLNFYTVATSHKDYSEGMFCSGSAFGLSETAESVFTGLADRSPSLAATPNYWGMGNADWPGWADLNHVWQSNGYATIVNVY